MSTADQAMRFMMIGTDTGVGKSHVTIGITAALRRLNRRVWLSKPVACGEWQDNCAEDVRLLSPSIGDDQDPASLCRHQWPEACSPHLAAEAESDICTLDMVEKSMRELLTGDHDLIVEAAGGVLSPLTTDRKDALDLAETLQLPVVLVTRPHLGSINHTRLSCREIEARGAQCLGIIINYHDDVELESVAISTFPDVLKELCPYPVLGRSSFQNADTTLQDEEMKKTEMDLLAQTLIERIS